MKSRMRENRKSGSVRGMRLAFHRKKERKVQSRLVYSTVVEIGYNIGSLWWDKGYTTEALKKVIEFLFNEVDVDTICARHLVKNPASGKVMQKAGLKLEGILRQREICNYTNTLMDVAYYSILKDEYKNKKTSN